MGDGKQVGNARATFEDGLWRSVVYPLVLALLALSACSQPSPAVARLPTPTVEVRHIDAVPLMVFMSDALTEEAFQSVEEHRLERGTLPISIPLGPFGHTYRCQPPIGNSPEQWFMAKRP